MASKKLNETKQLQEVNNNLIINFNERMLIKMLTKSWKNSEPYLKLMEEYQNLNSNSAIDWNQRYEKEYEKFVKLLLGENAQFKKTSSKKSSLFKKELAKNATSSNKTMGLNPSQLRLLSKRKLSRVEDLFPSRVVRGYQASQEAIESEIKQPRQAFLNNNESVLASLPTEQVVKNDLTLDDNIKSDKVFPSSEETENIISKLNPNQQWLIRQCNESYWLFKSQTQGSKNDSQNEKTIESLKGFNEQVKEHANNWGLNQNQLELLSRRDNTKHDFNPYSNWAREGYHPEEDYSLSNRGLKPRSLDEIKDQMNLSKNQLELLSRRNSHPSEWKQHMQQITHKKDKNETPIVINPEHVIKKRDQMVKESLSRSLGKTKKQIGGKYIRNFIKGEPKQKPIFKTDLYLEPDITRQINPLMIKPLKKINSKLSVEKNETIGPNLTFTNAISSKQKQPFLNGTSQNSVPTKTIRASNNKTLIEQTQKNKNDYISTIDPKKRPNLKKLKYGNDYEKNNNKVSNLKITKKQSNLIAEVNNQTFIPTKRKDADLILYTRKELKDYQIDYADSTKKPNLTVDLTENEYTYAGYHPREIREIHRRQLEQLHQRLLKEKLIKKNIRKERRYQKKLNNKKEKPKPLPQILIEKYRAEGKKVIDGFLVEDYNNEKNETISSNNKVAEN
ncbi:MAG: hypothetical protein OHM56_00215 [Spiroplasma phoeniceum]|nr:MAG: hypothetical protein OHM57_12725 [Spiroplasma phoeniceum]UZQ32460.1 MAG: hypothetical protein OHM56_00215 [Spiroplasma phoeniceum]